MLPPCPGWKWDIESVGERREPALMEAGLLRTWGGAYGFSKLRAVGVA